MSSHIGIERGVLGAILMSPDTYWDMRDRLRSDHFVSKLHQRIYSSIGDLMEEGKKLSLTLLSSRLGEEEIEDNVSVPTYLAVLLKDAEELGSPRDFADVVIEAGEKRRVQAIAEKMLKATKSEKPSIDIAAEAEAALLDVMHATTPRRPKKLSDLIEKVVRGSQRAKEQDVLPGYSTGLLSLDEMLGLILGGDLGFIIGSQGDGKSALGQQLMEHMSLSKPTLTFQMEMEDEQQAARSLVAASNVDIASIMEGAYDFDGERAIQDAQHRLRPLNMYIHDEPKMTVRKMKSVALGMMRTTGLGAICIDQLDKIKSEVRHKDRFEQSREITGDLKDWAKEMKIPIICLAQRTRAAQRREDPVPEINDADAPSIERDADWVIGVWRHVNWLRRQRPPQNAGGEKMDAWEGEMRRHEGKGEMIVLKRRRGKAFEQREFIWNGKLTRFYDL